jgi:hypothetical protein
MRVRALVLGVVAVVALTSGCGDRTEPDGVPAGGQPAGGQPAAGQGKVDLDKVDPCTLLTNEELQAFFGEPAGEKEPKGGAFLKGCALDDASGTSYVFVSVMVSPLGAKKQFDFDKSQTKNPTAISGVGEEAFGNFDDDEASIETHHRDALVIVSVLLYSYTDKLDDPAATVDKLTTLTKQVLTRL